MTRILAIALVPVGALTIGADSAAAQARPWCLIMPGLATSCIYYTFEQCLASRIGNSTYCGANPDYAVTPPGVIPAIRGRRR